jgi:hypothetical protein
VVAAVLLEVALFAGGLDALGDLLRPVVDRCSSSAASRS